MRTLPAGGLATCEAHKSHRPEPTYFEAHHIIPQAWQHFWKPDGAQVVSGLWDSRVAILCRTGHGNVHFWLVKLMKVYEASHDSRDAYRDAVAMIAAAAVPPNRKELAIAHLAMSRYTDAGGSLTDLCRAGFYGAI